MSNQFLTNYTETTFLEKIKDDLRHCKRRKFSCKGYDTYGPFKLVGGIAKGHPDEKDLTAAVDFYKEITK